MRIDRLMTRRVRTCRPEDSLSVAAQQMWDGDCGCIPVVDESDPPHVVGILTDRDICMASHFRGRPPAEVRVGEVMCRDVRTVRGSQKLADAEAIMSDAEVRRLPVVDARGRLVGILSLADLARQAQRSRRSRRPPITETEVGDTLSAICAPRAPALGA